jgi:hypothetical protein
MVTLSALALKAVETDFAVDSTGFSSTQLVGQWKGQKYGEKQLRDDGDDLQSIDDAAAKLNASPAAKAAIQSAGLTPREYVVFSFSLLQTGLGAWAADQPGGKLPPGTSKANVDFYKKHQADLKKLETFRQGDDCDDDRDDESDE